MKLAFDLESVEPDQTDLYVATGGGKTPKFGFVRIDGGVRDVVVRAAVATWMSMQEEHDGAQPYDPSNKHSASDFLYFPLDDPFAAKARYLHTVTNPEEVTNPLEVLPRISLYMARLYDREGRSLTAVRRVSSPGRMLEKRPLARLLGEELQLVKEPQFLLSEAFDFLIDGQYVFIYRPGAFETACGLQKAIKEAVRSNIDFLKQEVGYVDFDDIEATASGSLRSARELAAIRAHGFHENLSRARLLSYCEAFGIPFCETAGKIVIDRASHLDFLRLVSRKILGIQLTDDGPESYNVSARTTRQR